MVNLLRPLPSRGILAALMTLMVSLTVACGAAASAVPTLPPPERAAAAVDNGIRPILATKELRVGTQRVSFLLAGPKALIKAPEAQVTSRFLEDASSVSERKQAAFHLWPYGIRGAYSTELTFDRPGRWQLDIVVEDNGSPGETQLIIDVAERSIVPDIGSMPPPSRTKTLEGTGSFEDLTTDFTPDPDLYQVSIDQAITGDKPAVIVFATPAFCTSPTCGPQVDTVTELKDAHPGEANFIHVEIYDNPAEIQGDLSKAVLVDAVEEWGLTELTNWFNESWTFVLDSEGRIQQRFEGFVTLTELEESLRQVLEPG